MDTQYTRCMVCLSYAKSIPTKVLRELFRIRFCICSDFLRNCQFDAIFTEFVCLCSSYNYIKFDYLHSICVVGWADRILLFRSSPTRFSSLFFLAGCVCLVGCSFVRLFV